MVYRKVHTKHPHPPWHVGTPSIRGVFKAWWSSVFLPRKIHFHKFFPIFISTDCWEIFVLSTGGEGGVYSVEPQKSQILVLNREGVFGINFTVYIFYVFFYIFVKKRKHKINIWILCFTFCFVNKNVK